MAVSELEASLAEYKEQLSRVESALSVDSESSELKDLKSDLTELLKMTETSLLEAKKAELLEEVSRRRISLEGEKCQAPFSINGVSAYHNAIVFSDEGDGSVKVVYSNPLVEKMKACERYMAGTCSLAPQECPNSHGESVFSEELKDYVEPNFEKIISGEEELFVLARNKENGLWEHAKTLQGDSSSTSVLVQFQKGGHRGPIVLPVEDVLVSERVEHEEEEGNTEFAFVPDDVFERIQGSASSLGDWEKHTRGIGSKLMSKMGYIFGTGLGKNAEGRVEPVTCVICPQGKSLDYCLETLKRKKSLPPTQVPKKKEAKEEPPSFIDFMNSSFSTRENIKEEETTSHKAKSESCLKIESFKIDEEMSKLKSEIKKLNDRKSKSQSNDSAVMKSIESRLSSKTAELNKLNSKHKALQKERVSRSNRKKLSIF